MIDGVVVPMALAVVMKNLMTHDCGVDGICLRVGNSPKDSKMVSHSPHRGEKHPVSWADRMSSGKLENNSHCIVSLHDKLFSVIITVSLDLLEHLCINCL